MKTSLLSNCKSKILFLFLFFTFTSISLAQTPHYYNYNTAVGSNTFPFGQTGGKQCQWLVLANEFSQPTTASTGRSISHLWFYMAGTGSATFTNLTIKLGQTAITSLPTGAFYSGTLTTVYSRASVTLSSTISTWMDITLDTPFPYDPAQSLVIDVGQCGAVLTGSMSVYQTTLTGYRRSWSTGGCPFVYNNQGTTVLNCGISLSPLNGTYSIPGNYSTISSAITELNNYGVSGAVTFNVAPGYTETAPAGGLILGSTTLNATTSSTNKIIFQKSGSGTNPLVTAPVGTTTNLDGIWIIQGTDYVSINGIDLQESASNITTTTQMEWGYALLKLSATDGCQYDTIKNCTVTLNKSNTASKGIYLNNHTATSITALTLTSTTGANTYNRIYSNNITNVYIGIYTYGFSDSNYYDLNNYIGYSSSTGNTITNFGGSSSATYGIYAFYQRNLNIYYNTVNGALSNTTTAYGIYTGTSINSTGYIRYNTVTITPSSSGYGIYNNMGGTGTTNTIYINNNTVQNCTTTSTFAGIANNASCYNLSIYSNQIINNTIATSNESYLIYTPGDVGNILSIYSNSIYSNSNTSAGTFYGICNYPATATTSNIYQNSVYSITSAAKVYGIFCRYSLVANIYRNNVYALSTSGTGYFIYGHYYMGITTLNAYNNFVSDINTPSASLDLAIVGIAINSDVTTANLFYNTVFLNESSSGANFGTTCINASTTPTVDMRNNILVNTSAHNGTGSTVAYRRSNTTLTTYSSTSDNNCFYAGTPGINNLLFYDGANSIQTIDAYRTFVSTRDASSFTELPPFINISTTPYNLHLNTTDTTQCEKGGIPISSPISITNDYDGNTRNTILPDVGADEFSGIPDYPNIAYTNLPNTSSTSNFTTSNWATIRDISGINTTPGTAPRLYYKKSYNNNSYTSNTSTSNGWKWVESPSTSTPFDFTVDYSKLFGGSVSLGDKIDYFVVAQDILGVPKLSIKSGTFASSPASVDLTSAAFPVTGTINYYMVSATTPLSGDYYISLNLFNSITGKNLVSKEFTRKVIREITTDVMKKDELGNEDKIQNHNSKNINKTEKVEVEEKYYALSENGVKYEGPTYVQFTPEIRKKFNIEDKYFGLYANISCAIGDLNASGISASVSLILLDANYGDSGTPEDFPITVNSIVGASPSSTITIKPSTGITSTVSGSSPTSIFQLNGTSYITIDGSNSGGTSKNLTIQNTNSADNTAAIWLSSLGTGDGATYNTIKNCNILTGTNTLTSYGIFSGGTSIGTAGADNDNLQIINNSISKSYCGINISGTSGGEHNSVLINGNTIGSNTSTDYVLYYGINTLYMINSTVSQNEIYNMKQNGAKYGIYSSTGSSYNTYSKNKIHDFDDLEGNTTYSITIGMAFVTGLTDNTIDNNIIYKVFHRYGTTNNYYICGIRIIGGTNYKIYNNSISMTGTFTRATTGLYATCLQIYSTATSNMDLRNNIFYNTVSNPGYTVNNYLMFVTATSTFTNINYNNYYTTGTNLGYYNGTICSNLSAWKTITSQDTFSINADPGFTSTTDLSINTNSTNCWNINGGAYPLSTITSDIAGNPRSSVLNTGPADIGAYEFTPVVASPNLTVTGLPPTDGNNSSILFAGNNLAIITWHTGSGTLPASISAVFRPQVNPPNPTGNYANENLQITATGGSGYTYDIVYYYNLARQYTIASESDIRLAKYDASIGWEQYSTTPNATLKNITVTDINTQFSTFSLGDANSPLPVNMKSFTSKVNGRDVKLIWITENEQNNKGFEIERKIENGTWNKVGYLKGSGNTNKPVNYSFDDNKLDAGKYNYRLKQIDYNGNYTYFNLSTVIDIVLPKEFKLSQNYPNPFNPTTKIDYELPFDSKVRIAIYDMLGREVKILVSGEQKQAGYYTVELNATNLASGTYFYRMIANSQNKDFIFTKKMVILK